MKSTGLCGILKSKNLSPTDQVRPDDAILIHEHQNNDVGDQPGETDNHPGTAELADHLSAAICLFLIEPTR